MDKARSCPLVALARNEVDCLRDHGRVAHRAYVALSRTYLPDEREIIVYRIDPDSTFRFVRRAPVFYSGLYALVLSDGTIFESKSSTVGDFITGYFPDNSSRVVWREEDATTVVSNIYYQLLVGPRLPP
jgi:hypothetical protein